QQSALPPAPKFDQALAAAGTVDEVINLAATLDGIRHYMKRRRENLNNVNEAMRRKILCHRKLGKMLATMAKHLGGRPSGNPSAGSTSLGNQSVGSTSFRKTLRDIGI